MPDGIPESPRVIAYMRFGGIGEILAITPALVAIRRHWPTARMVAMVPSHAREILDRLGVADAYISGDRAYAARWSRYGLGLSALRELIRVCAELRWHAPDLFLVFNHLYFRRSVIKPAIFSWASGSPVRVGFDSYGRGWFLTHRVPDDFFEPRHLVERNRDFLNLLGIEDAQVSKPLLGVREQDRRTAESLLAEVGLCDRSFVACTPGSSKPTTRWMPERFAEVLRILRVRYGLTPLLLGAGHERDLCATVAALAGGAPVLAGRTDVHVLGAILERAALLLSNVTGSVWVAAAMGTPTVAVFGSGEFAIWGTYPDPSFRAVRHPVPCAPCLRRTCGHHSCMRLIDVETVLAAVESVIAR